MSNIFTRVSRSLSYPPSHHWWYDFPLLYWYGLIIIHSTFSLPYFVSHHLFPDLHSTFYPFPTYWYTFFDSIPYSHHLHVSLMVWPLILSLISPLTFPLVTFRSMAHEVFFYALHLVHNGMGLIIGYLSLVSLHFFHPITLAYVTSHVLRPPWGHEIRCYL